MLHGFEEFLLSVCMLTRWMCFWRSPVSMFFEGTFQNLPISDRVNMAPSLVPEEPKLA